MSTRDIQLIVISRNIYNRQKSNKASFSDLFFINVSRGTT